MVSVPAVFVVTPAVDSVQPQPDIVADQDNQVPQLLSVAAHFRGRFRREVLTGNWHFSALSCGSTPSAI